VTRELIFCEKHLRFWGRICLLGHRIIAGSPDIPISSCPGRRETVDLASILDVLGRTVVKPCTPVHRYSCYDDFWKLSGQISYRPHKGIWRYSAETCLALTPDVKHTSRKRSYCFLDAQGTRGKHSYYHQKRSMIHMMCDSEKKISLCFGMFNICIFEISEINFFL